MKRMLASNNESFFSCVFMRKSSFFKDDVYSFHSKYRPLDYWMSDVSVSMYSCSFEVKERHLEYEATLYSCIDSVFNAGFIGMLKIFYFRFHFTRLDLENRVHAVFLNFRITHFVRSSSSVFTNKKLKKLKKNLQSYKLKMA